MDINKSELAIKSKEIVSAMTKKEVEALIEYSLKTEDNGVMVEIGSYLGCSGTAIGTVAQKKGSKFYMIDPFYETSRDECEENIKKRGVNQYNIIQEPSAEYGETFDHDIDFIFIDGDHLYDGVKKDCDAFLPLVKPGGFVLFHDYNSSWEGVKKAVDERSDLKIIEIVDSTLVAQVIQSEKKDPLVSIILTTYNRPNRLEKAINSVLNQTYKNIEVFLMDDNSSDEKQKEILSKYSKHKNVRLFTSNVKDEDRAEKVRYSVLINAALKRSNGKYIAYICDDDRYELDRIERFVHKFESEQNIHFVGGNQLCVKELHGQEVPMPHPIREQTKPLKNANCSIDHTSVMHRKSVLEKVSQWPTHKSKWGSSDGEFFQKLGEAGFIMHPLGGEPTDTHVYHDGSWTKDANHRKLGTEEEINVKQ